MKQRSFASLSFDAKKKPTRREKFLGEMDKVVPWEALLALIEPSYPTSGRRGRPPMPASVMLRIHFMQQWYALRAQRGRRQLKVEDDLNVAVIGHGLIASVPFRQLLVCIRGCGVGASGRARFVHSVGG